MIFQPEHVGMIKRGTKTATCRDWKKKMAKIMGIYPVQERMFQPKDECEVFIRAHAVYRQKLGEMTDLDAEKEGGYTLEEFKELWKDINGEWDPDLVVWVVEFYPSSEVQKSLWSFVEAEE